MAIRSKGSVRSLLVTVTACAAALIGVLQVASPAEGAGSTPLKYVSKNKAVPSDETVGVTTGHVTCPADHPLVTGGGLEVNGTDPGLDLEVGTSLSSNHLRNWTGAANNNSGNPATMTVFGICARSGITHRVIKKTIGPDRQGKAQVLCPSGTKVTGGGVGVSGSNHTQEVASSYPFDSSDANAAPDNGWRGRGNNGQNKKVTLTVEVVCSHSGTYSYVHSSRKSVPNNAQVPRRATCPTGSQVTGGGLSITGTTLNTEVADSFPFDGSDAGTTPDDGWQGNANNDGSGQTLKAQAFAICRH